MKQSSFISRLLTGGLAAGGLMLALLGCTPSPPDSGPPPMENFSVATPTPQPTATPFARPETPAETETVERPEDEGDGLLSGFLNEEETTEAAAEPTAESAATGPAPEFAPPAVEPSNITIDLQNGDLNTWVEVSPPPGWRITQGLDGIVLAKEPELIPASSFVMVRRWGNVVNLEDYVAYLPDAVEETNSNVAFKLGGYEWEGVFVTNQTNSYRAFFGVSNDVLPSFSLLVFVPGPDPLPGEEAISRETLLDVWTFDVGDLNSILRRMAFY